MPAQPVQNDASLPLDVSLIGQSPHVFAYRMWIKEPGESWTEVMSGNTEDDIPDHATTGPHPDSTKVLLRMAVGGHPNSFFQLAVIFSQGGRVPHGGMNILKGKTGAGGGGGKAAAWILI